MRLTEVAGQKPVGLFETYVEFTVDTDIDDKEIDAICEWVSYTFETNFILMECSHKTIAGGCMDNAHAWAEGWAKDDESNFYTPDYYHLRCSKKDLTFFLLKYPGEVSERML